MACTGAGVWRGEVGVEGLRWRVLGGCVEG